MPLSLVLTVAEERCPLSKLALATEQDLPTDSAPDRMDSTSPDLRLGRLLRDARQVGSLHRLRRPLPGHLTMLRAEELRPAGCLLGSPPQGRTADTTLYPRCGSSTPLGRGRFLDLAGGLDCSHLSRLLLPPSVLLCRQACGLFPLLHEGLELTLLAVDEVADGVLGDDAEAAAATHDRSVVVFFHVERAAALGAPRGVSQKVILSTGVSHRWGWGLSSWDRRRKVYRSPHRCNPIVRL